MWEIGETHPGLCPTASFGTNSEKLQHITSATEACYM